MQPKASVIVPVYNTENYLAECIRSILAQTFTDFELLLLDDASTDRSLCICRDFAASDPRIRVFSLSKGGVSATRNRGIDEARAEWICFVDSDDVLEPDYLSAFFEQGCLEPDCLNQQGWKILCGGKTTVGWQYPDLLVDKSNLHETIDRCKIINSNGPCFRLFNKPMLNKLGLRFNTCLTIREDALFVYQYRTAVSKVRLLPATAYQYRRERKRLSLSHRIHRPQQFILLKELLPPVIARFIGTFDLWDAPYAQTVYCRNKSTIIASGIKALYAHQVTKRERTQLLRQLLGDDTYYNDTHFRPVGLALHLRRLYRTLPPRWLDMLLYCLLKPYYRLVYFQKFP